LLRFAVDDGKHLFPADRYPVSPRIQTLRGILAKFSPIAPAPMPPAARPTPEERDPSRRPRGAITAALDDRRGRGCIGRRETSLPRAHSPMLKVAPARAATGAIASGKATVNMGGNAVNRPRAADDFATIKARMEELRHRRRAADDFTTIRARMEELRREREGVKRIEWPVARGTRR